MLSEDKKEVLFNAVMIRRHGNMTVNYVKLQGLDPEKFYKDQASGKSYSGAALMEAGLPLPVEEGEYLAYQIYLKQ